MITLPHYCKATFEVLAANVGEFMTAREIARAVRGWSKTRYITYEDLIFVYKHIGPMLKQGVPIETRSAWRNTAYRLTAAHEIEWKRPLMSPDREYDYWPMMLSILTAMYAEMETRKARQ